MIAIEHLSQTFTAPDGKKVQAIKDVSLILSKVKFLASLVGLALASLLWLEPLIF